jgi:hypothetical protein
MKARVINILASVLAALAAVDLAIIIPSMRAAKRRIEASSGNSNVVHEIYFIQFGLVWWVVPVSLVFAAAALFVLNRWSHRRGRNA